MAIEKIKTLVETLEGLAKMHTPHSESWYKTVRQTYAELRKAIDELERCVDVAEEMEVKDNWSAFVSKANRPDTFFNNYD